MLRLVGRSKRALTVRVVPKRFDHYLPQALPLDLVLNRKAIRVAAIRLQCLPRHNTLLPQPYTPGLSRLVEPHHQILRISTSRTLCDLLKP